MDSLWPNLEAVVNGKKPALGIGPDGRELESLPAALLPGAFNPVHAGHWGLAFTIFVLATVLAFHGLASGARAPMMVMTAISLLALGLAA